MRKMIILLIIISALTICVRGVELPDQWDGTIDAEKMMDKIPERAEKYLGKQISPQIDFAEDAMNIFSDTISQSGGYIKTSLALILKICLIIILCKLTEAGNWTSMGHSVSLAGVLAMTVCCAADFRTMIGLGKSTMEELVDFSTVLIPVMASAAAATGSATGAGVLYGVTILFSRILIGLCGYVLLPGVYAYLALGVADASMRQDRLKKIREFLSWTMHSLLKWMMYAFTGFVTLSGILAGSVDAMAIKAAKLTLSGVVPVVGGIISDAAETILYSAGIMKSAIGTFGMLALLAVFLSPFLRMGIHYLALKLTGALCGIVGSVLCGYVECITNAMGFLLAMLGSCIVMCLLSCCCFMRFVGV